MSHPSKTLTRRAAHHRASAICVDEVAIVLRPVRDADPRSWDRAMMARLRAGDDTALAAIFDRYAGLVNGIAVRLVGADQSGDVTQDVFVDLWQRPDRYDPDLGGLATYLAVTSRRRAIDILRSRQRRRARENRVTTTEPAASASAELAAIASLAAEEVRAAIGRLPIDQRRAIELAYLDGLTYRQVAVEMATSEGTAKSRLRLGLARLARELTIEARRDEEPAWN